jgi:hypothetical protein
VAASFAAKYREAVEKLGPRAVARILGARVEQIERWAISPDKLPESAYRKEPRLSISLRRLKTITRTARRKSPYDEETQDSMIEEFIGLASKSRTSHRENQRIMALLEMLGNDNHKTETYLRDVI